MSSHLQRFVELGFGLNVACKLLAVLLEVDVSWDGREQSDEHMDRGELLDLIDM